ncbi:MAG: type II secretion system protein M [Proteobacteria bacterium]|nr:type II secretion system protein M [Pseudomonadota bacterium]
MKLGKREKFLVSLVSCCIAVFLLFQFIIFPFLDKREVIKRGIEVKRDGLKEMASLRTEYESYKKGAAGLQSYLMRREKSFTLFSFLEQAAGQAKVKDHIKHMKPSASRVSGRFKESTIEMKLDEINVKQLVDYLYLIESPENVVSIKRISIKDSKGAAGYLDAVMQVLTFEN